MRLTKVDLVEHFQQEIDMCRIEIDNGSDSAYIIWNYTNLLTYLGEEIICTFRQDIYRGTPAKFVNTLAKVGVVHTLEREDNIKLYVDKLDNHCTISFRDIAEGHTVERVTVYVVDVTMDSSARATWWDLTVQDRDRKIATLRLFNPEGSDSDYKGRYILCDIRRNKYGFSTDAIVTVDSSFSYSPEVLVAESFITKTFADDSQALNAMQSVNFIETAKRYVAEEPGYLLVRLAMELDIANEMANLTRDVPVSLLRHALLLDKFWVLNNQSPYHQEIVGFASASRARLDDVKQVLQVLYSDSEEFASARLMVSSIKHLADNLVTVKKRGV